MPFLTDSEENISEIIDLCAETGVYGIISFGMGMTLREGNREYFYKQLDKHFPGLKQKYIRTFGERYECLSPSHDPLSELFHERCREKGVVSDLDTIFSYLKSLDIDDRQIPLF